jgi:hypothetical protein
MLFEQYNYKFSCCVRALIVICWGSSTARVGLFFRLLQIELVVEGEGPHQQQQQQQQRQQQQEQQQ